MSCLEGLATRQLSLQWQPAQAPPPDAGPPNEPGGTRGIRASRCLKDPRQKVETAARIAEGVE